jgi:hydrogenase nickel incorporation protein HypA/HybF
VHELSIARNIVSIVTQVAQEENSPRVCVIHLEVGELSCLVPSALEFAFEVAAQGSPAEGAKLHFKHLPVMVFCHTCDKEVALPSAQRFRCPLCDEPTSDLRSGRELEIARVELEDRAACANC